MHIQLHRYASFTQAPSALNHFTGQKSPALRRGNLFYSCGPAATRALPSSLLSYFLKFLINLAARSFAFASHSEASAYVSRGSRMAGSTPGSSVGTSKLK